jgi:hypothetical protein
MLPSAAATPSTDRTRRSSEASNGGGSTLSCSTISAEVIVTSVPCRASLKMSSNEALIVSVNT